MQPKCRNTRPAVCSVNCIFKFVIILFRSIKENHHPNNSSRDHKAYHNTQKPKLNLSSLRRIGMAWNQNPRYPVVQFHHSVSSGLKEWRRQPNSAATPTHNPEIASGPS